MGRRATHGPSLTGTFRLSRVSGGAGDYWMFEVTDGSSGVFLIEGHLDDDSMGKMMAGREVPVKFTLPGAHLAGCDREIKTEFVLGEPTQKWGATEARDAEAAAALLPYEVDGWQGSTYDWLNSNRSSVKSGAKGRSVQFTRYLRAGKPVDSQTGLPL